MADPTHNPFSSAALERRGEWRVADDWIAIAERDPDCRFLVASGTRQLVRMQPSPGVALLDGRHPLVAGSDRSRWLLLGRWGDARCVLIETDDRDPAVPEGCEFSELRPLLTTLDAGDGTLLACARALQVWRLRHRHCGVCGAPTVSRQAGHSLACSSSECGAEFFPRIDPAVIVVVSAGDEILLGRQASWARGRYSALAGFVEPGESLEDAVAREVAEETGVRIDGCRYFASQAWPFPSSLMLGFHAWAERQPLRLDEELEEARWFRPAELADGGELLLPPRQAIARSLIEHWYREVTGRPLPATLRGWPKGP